VVAALLPVCVSLAAAHASAVRSCTSLCTTDRNLTSFQGYSGFFHPSELLQPCRPHTKGDLPGEPPWAPSPCET
jgi:hypothetical protein